MRQLQIGVIGSCSDLRYSLAVERLAMQIGAEIAAAGYILVFGAEKDLVSLPTVAAKAARSSGGCTVGITYEKGLDVFEPSAASVVVATGMIRGGGREMSQALSCDGILALNGGSGTLNEIAVAYQADIPVVLMAGTGGWADRLDATYLDERQRYQFESAQNAPDALKKLVKMIKSRQGTSL